MMIMDIAYCNGKFLPKEEIRISPDDRGFIFGDGVYEVIKWYGSFFFDIESHVTRLKRSLREVRINWQEADTFPLIAKELIEVNNLRERQALIYLQVTRGEAPRNHAFPAPEVSPTTYAFARETEPQKNETGPGVRVILRKDIRWSRCDIKSVSLLANTLSFQDAHEQGMQECIFVRDGVITEGSRSNIFLIADGILYTHPESEYILSGVTRKNIIRFARESGIVVKEVPFPEQNLSSIEEAFISNSSSEVNPVIGFESMQVGNGRPGPVTLMIYKKFLEEINSLKG
jgi:D-alanine transaminase